MEGKLKQRDGGALKDYLLILRGLTFLSMLLAGSHEHAVPVLK